MKNWQEDVIVAAVIIGVAFGYFVQSSFVAEPQSPIIYPSASLVVYEPLTVVPSAPAGSNPSLAGGGACGQ